VLADELVASPPRWFDIDDEDFRAWLGRHGARQDTIDSPLLRGLYHAAFAVHEPLGAGTILHALLRMVSTYKGAILYRMQAGMGDTVFAPLYEVLQRRGVHFQFFTSVEALELSTDRRRIERVRIARQATVASGKYQPLIDVDGLPCWPAEPLHEQLVEGEAIKAAGHNLESFWNQWPAVAHEVLEAGPPLRQRGAGHLAGRPAAHLPRAHRRQQQSALSRHGRARSHDADAGRPAVVRPGPRGARLARAVGRASAHPHSVRSAVRHLLGHDLPARARALARAREAAPPQLPVRAARRRRGRARARGSRLPGETEGARACAPRALARATRGRAVAGTGHARGLRVERLVDPQGREGAARLDAQYHCAVVHPSDRYNLSLPGSVRCRLRAHESGYTNLILAGDWTKTALSIGCLEAATMSGFAAARVVDRDCRTAYGDWLPEEPARISDVHERSSALPPYISSGQLIAQPPIRMRTSLSMFMLEASLPELTALCDRTLNLRGSPTHYRPLGPHVTLYCSAQDRHGPIEDPIGVCPENDFGIWVPLIARGPDGRERHVVFTPWLWVKQRELRMVFLKQFPDAADATRACYQAIVEAPVVITSDVRSKLLPGGFSVDIVTHASHPLVDLLGLHPTRRTLASTELSSRLSLWAGFEARAERGEIIHDAVAARRPTVRDSEARIA
jgi:hypothetical protein